MATSIRTSRSGILIGAAFQRGERTIAVITDIANPKRSKRTLNVFAKNPAERAGIKYLSGLQNHPKVFRPGEMFANFYGNHGR